MPKPKMNQPETQPVRLSKEEITYLCRILRDDVPRSERETLVRGDIVGKLALAAEYFPHERKSNAKRQPDQAGD